MLDSIIGGISAVGGLISGARQDEAARDSNALAREQLDYQRHLNAEQMVREDSAYQRKVADLKKAGLNPALATGGAGSPSAALRAGEAPTIKGQTGVSDAMARSLAVRQLQQDYSMSAAQAHILHNESVLSDARVKNAQDLADAELNLQRARALGAMSPYAPVSTSETSGGFKIFDLGISGKGRNSQRNPEMNVPGLYRQVFGNSVTVK